VFGVAKPWEYSGVVTSGKAPHPGYAGVVIHIRRLRRRIASVKQYTKPALACSIRKELSRGLENYKETIDTGFIKGKNPENRVKRGPDSYCMNKKGASDN
jgi:hypothetical protein